MKKRITIFTGSGISSAAGIPTFREAGKGLWENYDVSEVCTAGCFERNPEKAYGFYSYIHKKYQDIIPTKAHHEIAALQERGDVEVSVITQNVDDLHEKAGSKAVLHLHGELSKIQAVDDPRWIRPWTYKTIMHEDTIIEGHHIRPHIVMFGEDVPNMSTAIQEVENTDILVIIGTSLVVYPAASLVDFTHAERIVYIDPQPTVYPVSQGEIEIIKEPADTGFEKFLRQEGLWTEM